MCLPRSHPRVAAVVDSVRRLVWPAMVVDPVVAAVTVRQEEREQRTKGLLVVRVMLAARVVVVVRVLWVRTGTV